MCTVSSANPDFDIVTDTNRKPTVTPFDGPDSVTIIGVIPFDQDSTKGGQVTSQSAQAEAPDHTGLLAAVAAAVLVLLVLLGIVIVFVVIVLLVKKRYYNSVMVIPL